MITHHPTDELLVDYASGAMPEPLGLLMAAHLSLCGACNAQSGRLDDVGGALLGGLPEAEMAQDALARTMARLAEPETPAAAVPEPDAETRTLLPAPLWSYVGGGLARLNWARRGPALREAVLPVPVAGWRVSLLRLEAGGSVPKHTHRGMEYTLVLAGGLTNRQDGDHIARGDLDIADSSREHQQVADAGMDCLCLAVLDAPIRITGPLGWVANPFLKF